MTPTAVGIGTGIASALLALWLLARYRDFGPRTLGGSAAACFVAMLLLGAIRPAIDWTVAAAGPAVALLAVAVPIFVFSFWSGGTLIRAFLSGPGTPTHAYARRWLPRSRRRR